MKPGPGVSKDEPRKQGAARFFELLFREFWDFMKLNILFCLIALPSVLVFLFGFIALYPYLAFIISFFLAVALAFPIGGALTAYIFYITKMMRDEPSYVWYEFKRKFKENYKQAAPVGMVSTAFVYTQIMLWTLLTSPYSGVDGGFLWFFAGILSLVIFGMITPYIFMHLAYIDLKTSAMFKNSILMSFGYFPRSFMAAFLGGLPWIIFGLFFPASLIAIPFVGFIVVSISILLTLMWAWKPFDSHFKIEETLVARLDEEGTE